ncbi:hypothetical protein GUJ93_ZPchr0001g31262 [Zizania palustris]|uniref:Dof-type domain-containing protein n=1 Tax=Zizania palustris TaxID=103762 RepID=A0A8J5V021_ZIZPA|nr:hypothetical protein GUJ93_ZPchr0001g31262 [Zizania palustris]
MEELKLFPTLRMLRQPRGSVQEKILKEPDKILPCPRCNSMATKFCYFNNYNVNQPRHFCRNCQRYWTAGGATRNVPVGAGRRKNKHASPYHQAMMPCNNTIAPGDVPDVVHHQAITLGSSVLPGTPKENERATKFGREVSLSKSLASVLDAGGTNNTDLVSLPSGDNTEEKSCASSAAVSGCSQSLMPDNAVKKEQINVSGCCNGVALPYPAGPALMLPCSLGSNSVAVMAATQFSTQPILGVEDQIPYLQHMVPAPGLCTPVVPFPVVPPLWGCFPGWPSGMWSSSCPGRNKITCSGNSSLKLGKHSREESLQEEEKMKRNLLVPKTLRIDDPAEAAKSSIWATLCIMPDKGMFKSFQSNALKNSKDTRNASGPAGQPRSIFTFSIISRDHLRKLCLISNMTIVPLEPQDVEIFYPVLSLICC